MTDKISIRTEERKCEVAWFAPICSDDYEFLGFPENKYKSSFEHCQKIALKADELGFNNMLCPSSYQVGQDTLTFASAIAPQLKQMSLLVAIRCGELHPPMLNRTIATLDHILKGNLTVNIISSDLPGTKLSSEARYAKSRETIEILKKGWTEDSYTYSGEHYELSELVSDPVKPYQNPGPLLYFGGMSEPARDLAAQHCDNFLMWPETEERLQNVMEDMSQRAAKYDRKLDFGLRIHVIVRETEEEAKAAAKKLVSKLESDKGDSIRNRALDAKSLGVSRQTEMRDMADEDGFVEPLLWTGVGRARSGCGCTLVGTPEQIVEKLNRYMDMGIRSFIFSGYPHYDECERVGKLILPHLPQAKIADIHGLIPKETPNTPLGNGERK